WDMCHSFLIVYYWNDTEFLTLLFCPINQNITDIEKGSQDVLHGALTDLI
ncbi:hypothetical protein AA437_004869, partial [Salmonella enterica subsp. enterica]|nr:hypothetical protein [Salmonella enterica subsp. enterica]